MRERGFCAKRKHDISDSKNKYSRTERSLKKANIFRERKKITFECTNNANGDITACGGKGEQGTCVLCGLTNGVLKADTNSTMTCLD